MSHRGPNRQRAVRGAVVALAVSFLASRAHGECKSPLSPHKIPEGATATEQEMAIAMQTLKRFGVDVRNYLKCLEFEFTQNRLSPDEQAQQHNAAVEGLRRTTEKFNEQVKIFKARS
jgi:hypothetical protein